MKILSAVALSVSLIAAGGAYAADTAPSSATAQAASKSCSKEAKSKGLKGDARTKFIKECKSGKSPS
jgi:psiF repeat-containing protein